MPKKKFDYFQSEDDEVTFTLIDEHTVARLQKDGEVTIPQKYLDRNKDMRWNMKQLNSKMLQGIMNGDPIPKIAESFEEVIGKNEVSTTRAARTMCTEAENKGRQDSYDDLAEQGVVQKKVWIATPDIHTRESHMDADGQEVDIDEPFILINTDGSECEMMFPADPDGDDEQVWNCRCSMRTKIVGFRRADGSVSKVDYGRDKTTHADQMAEEKERREQIAEAKAEETAKIDYSSMPDDVRDYYGIAMDTFAERMTPESIEKFNKVFKQAEYTLSDDGSYYRKDTNKIYLAEDGVKDTTVYHESTHWFDDNQNYTITDDWGYYKKIYNDDGDLIGKEWVEKTVTIKENASFSSFISWEWDKTEQGNESMATKDFQNLVKKTGISGDFTFGRDNAGDDMMALRDYVKSKGIDRHDPDYVHLSDFISAMTYDSNMGSLIDGGHSYNYWVNNPDNRIAEITAGYNVLKSIGREDLIEVERDLAPNLMQLIEEEWKKIW